jgi:hypothetical protein
MTYYLLKNNKSIVVMRKKSDVEKAYLKINKKGTYIKNLVKNELLIYVCLSI